MKKYILCVDGGGSKTAFSLTDTDGKPILSTKLSRSNPNDIGIDNTITLLLSGFQSLCEQTNIKKEQIASIFSGIAGVAADDFKSKIKAALSGVYTNSVIAVDHDGVNILYAAFPEHDGVGVICGTGTSCFVKKNDVLHRIGGYGLFDLLGGGYEIGRAAISHALRSIDGRDKESFLSESVKKKAGFNIIEELGTLITSGKNSIATYAPLVYEAYSHSDGYAEAILNSHIGYLAELINTAELYFDSHFEASLAGGISKNPITMKILKPMLSTNIKVTTLNCEPIYGAVARAKVLLEKGM